MSAQPDLSQYRPCAGVVLFNKDGKVFLGHRMGATGPHVWQFPQGGIDDGETPMGAALRELYEEIGIKPETVSLLGKIDDWLLYDFPVEYQENKKARGKLGQRQRWFAFLFHGTDDQFDLEAVPPTEFSEWQWSTLEKAQKSIVPFKHTVYARIAKEFSDFERPHE